MQSKYVVLELDTIQFAKDQPTITAYCLIETAPMDELAVMEHNINLHNKLIENYQKKNWKFCEDAIEHLIGRWNGEVDSFYRELLKRINNVKIIDLPADWSGTVKKY
jgi:hypothetical protein